MPQGFLCFEFCCPEVSAFEIFRYATMLSSPTSLSGDRKNWVKNPFWPMLLFSTLLHLGVLWIPTPAEKITKKPEEKAQKVVPGPKVVRLGDLVQKTATRPKPRTLVPLAKPLIPRTRSNQPVLSLKPKSEQQKSKSPVASMQKKATATPTPTPTPSSSPTPSPQPTPEDSGDYSQEFGDIARSFKQTSASSAVEVTGLPRAAFTGIANSFFVNAQQFMDDWDAKPELLPEIEDLQFREQETPDEVFKAIQQNFKGFKFTRVGSYAKGDLYEVKKGSTKLFVSISPAKASSVFVIWKQKPPGAA